MRIKTTLSPRLYFSYNQFMVYDNSVQLPGCDWTDQHTAQGFARRNSTVNFATLIESGYADVSVFIGAYQASTPYDRSIIVPFLVTSGQIIVEGPEEAISERNFSLPPGNYRLVASQRVTANESEAIDLCFELLTKPLERSTILTADNALNPPTPLVETSAVAGES